MKAVEVRKLIKDNSLNNLVARGRTNGMVIVIGTASNDDSATLNQLLNGFGYELKSYQFLNHSEYIVNPK